MSFGLARILGCGRETCAPGWDRYHYLYETYAKLYFVLSGSATYDNEVSKRRMTPGNVYFFPPHQRSQHVCPKSMDVFWLHLAIDSPLHDLWMTRIAVIQTWPASQWIYWEPVYSRLAEFADQRAEELGLRLQGMIMHLFAELAVRYPLDDDHVLANERARFDPAIGLMDSQFKRNPSLSEIAGSVGLSGVYFHRRFHAVFKITPYAYMLRRRMDLAHQLLLHSTESISDIAQSCGYADQFYFSRVFKRWFMVSPQNFRAKQKGKP